MLEISGTGLLGREKIVNSWNDDGQKMILQQSNEQHNHDGKYVR